MQKIQFDYFTGMEAEQYSFYRVPKLEPEEIPFEQQYAELKDVQDSLNPDEIVKANDIELSYGQEFDVEVDLSGIEGVDESKIKILFHEAKNETGTDFDTHTPDTYKAVYAVEPVSGHPAYRISRNITVKEPETEVQSERSSDSTVNVEDDTGDTEQSEEDSESYRETQNSESTADLESELTVSEVLEQAESNGIDLYAMEAGETVTFMAAAGNARSSQQVSVTRGAEYRYADYGYGTYLTYQYTVKFGNISATAYCVQPSKPGPGSGTYTINKVGDGKALAKVCYYGTKASGDDGFFTEEKQALEVVRKACNNKGYYVVDADIEKFFDNVNQDKLMKLVEQRISDRRILKLIRQWLVSGVLYGNVLTISELGTSQGSVISPLLANIYLNTLDRLWEKYGLTHGILVRYADDTVIICKNKKNANHALNLLQYIMAKLDLKLHPVKTKIVSMWDGKEGFDFLGMHHRRMTTETSKGQLYKETYQYPSRKAMKKMKAEIKKNVNGRSLLVAKEEDLIKNLNPKIIGWKNYYSTKTNETWMQELDWYIICTFTRWYNKKHQRRKHMSRVGFVRNSIYEKGLKKMARA